MKTRVFVLVPYNADVNSLLEVADRCLETHRQHSSSLRSGRFDYLCGDDGCFDDAIAEGRLPAQMKRALRGHICGIERLPDEVIPGALVTPDGRWHDLNDFGYRTADEKSTENRTAIDAWTARYRELLAENPYCWVLQYLAHS